MFLAQLLSLPIICKHHVHSMENSVNCRNKQLGKDIVEVNALVQAQQESTKYQPALQDIPHSQMVKATNEKFAQGMQALATTRREEAQPALQAIADRSTAPHNNKI